MIVSSSISKACISSTSLGGVCQCRLSVGSLRLAALPRDLARSQQHDERYCVSLADVRSSSQTSACCVSANIGQCQTWRAFLGVKARSAQDDY